MPHKPLIDIWKAGVEAVRGEAAVATALPEIATPTHIIAVGKAACDMARPAMAAFPDTPTLIVTKHGHSANLPGPATILEAGHPIPDAASLQAGAALLDTVSNTKATDHILMLVSGGASAVAEALPDHMTLDQWIAETEGLMAAGADIHEINTRRRAVSQIKGGKLLSHFKGKAITTLAISDVEGDALNVIGSGIGAALHGASFQFTAEIVASNAIARRASASATDETILTNDETLYADIHPLAQRIATHVLHSETGLHIFGGEPTVVLPKKPGRGGRNQALALLIAKYIAGTPNIEILVAGTDGTDGPTPDAGALVTGDTWQPEAEIALKNADAGTFLSAQNALITTGPTGTNVMDMLIARKS